MLCLIGFGEKRFCAVSAGGKRVRDDSATRAITDPRSLEASAPLVKFRKQPVSTGFKLHKGRPVIIQTTGNTAGLKAEHRRVCGA